MAENAEDFPDSPVSVEALQEALTRFNGAKESAGTTVPAELVGNEHLRWGYPGGNCALLISAYFVTCHDNRKRIPAWVSYYLTSESVVGETERTDDFRVFTGSLFLDENGALTEPITFIGDNGVAVPTHFYKVILAEFAVSPAPPAAPASALELYAFVMPNQPEQLDGEPTDYLVSVDLVEVLSGLDFFSALPDSVEEGLEEETATSWPRG